MSRKVIVNGESICYLPPVDASEIRYDLGSGNYGNVQTVLEGKVSKSGDTMTGNLNIVASNSGTTNVDSAIWIGNNIPDGQTGCSSAIIVAYARSQYYSAIYPDPGLTNNRTLVLPSKTGTVAVTSEVEENVYHYSGKLLDASSSISSDIEGYGVANISLRNGKARIDFHLQITQNSDTTGGLYNFGINRNLFKSAIGNVEVVPVQIGTFCFYNNQGVIIESIQGYGGAPELLGRDPQYWGMARIYNTSGSVGGLASYHFPIGTRIVGTIYGTY